MYPYIDLMGKKVASYGVMVIIGIIVTIIFIEYRCRRWKMSAIDQLYFLAFVMIFTIIGAKLLYLALNIEELLSHAASALENWKEFMDYMGGGFVFYGGLAGAVAGAVVYGRYFHQDISRMIDIAVPGIPLFHCFGRIGCFLSGCCYGCRSDSFMAVTYANALGAPNGVPLLPVQLFEAAFDLMLFFILLYAGRRLTGQLKAFGLYLLLYGTARFFLEFLRGDLIRGIWFFLSTSQWISLSAILSGLYLLLAKAGHNRVIHWIRSFEE